MCSSRDHLPATSVQGGQATICASMRSLVAFCASSVLMIPYAFATAVKEGSLAEMAARVSRKSGQCPRAVVLYVARGKEGRTDDVVGDDVVSRINMTTETPLRLQHMPTLTTPAQTFIPYQPRPCAAAIPPSAVLWITLFLRPLSVPCWTCAACWEISRLGQQIAPDVNRKAINERKPLLQLRILEEVS
jgi:hypothetical protein